MWQLFKAMIWGSGTALLTTALGAVTTKILAVTAGPAGIGMFSLLRATWQWLSLLATLNGQVAIVRNLSTRAGSEKVAYLRASAWIFVAGSFGAGVLCVVLAPMLALIIFKSTASGLIDAVRLIAVAIAFGAASIFLTSVINAARDIRALSKAQVGGAICTVLLAYPIARLDHPVGYVGLGIAGFAGTILIASLLIRRNRMLDGTVAPGNGLPLRLFLRDYLTTSATTAITGFCGAGLVVVLRAVFLEVGGLGMVGQLDAAWTLSTMGVAILTSWFNSYYFPLLSAAKDRPQEIRIAISRMLRLATIVSTVTLSLFVIAKPLVVQLIYTDQFRESLRLLRWLLIADFLKVTLFVVGMPMLAFAHNRLFLVSEVVWQAIILGMVLVRFPGTLEDVGQAVLCANAVYLALALRFVGRVYAWRPSARIAAGWVVGLGIIVVLSWSTWEAGFNVFIAGLAWMAMMIVMIFSTTTSMERRAALIRIGVVKERRSP